MRKLDFELCLSTIQKLELSVRGELHYESLAICLAAWLHEKDV